MSSRRSAAELRARESGPSEARPDTPKTWSGRRDSNPPRLRWERSAAPSGFVRVVPPAGLEPARVRVRTGCSTFELRRRCPQRYIPPGPAAEAEGRDARTTPRVALSPWKTLRRACHPLESNQNLSGFSRARRPTTQEWHLDARRKGRLALEFNCQCPVHTVSLEFRSEQMLGKPSMHACGSRLRFGLRGSNSHFQGQSLVFCRLNETRMSVSLERFELSPRGVKIRYVTVTPQTPERGRRRCVFAGYA